MVKPVGVTLVGVRLPRTRSGRLPLRRAPGRVLTVIVLVGVAVGGIAVYRASDSLLQACLAVTGIIVLASLIYFPLNLPYFLRARNALAALRSRLPNPEDAIPVRSTVRVDRFPPTEVDVLDDYLHPWVGYQVLSLGEEGLEIRGVVRRGDRARGICLKYEGISSVEAGVAAFGNFDERAIIVAGNQAGHEYLVGLVPVNAQSLLLWPIDREQFSRMMALVRGSSEEARIRRRSSPDQE